MKTLYLECNTGAGGDMLNAALFELLDDKDKYLKIINQIDRVKVSAEKYESLGIIGTRMIVKVDGLEEFEHFHGKENSCNVQESFHLCGKLHEHTHENPEHTHEHTHENAEHTHDHHSEHSHSSLVDVEKIISSLNVSNAVKSDALAIYNLIAEAESNAHGKPVQQIHFHEVGTLDAICDVVGFCLLKELLGIEKIISSPINVGFGTVKCAHGELSVPTPATAYILKNAVIYSNDIKGELCTPTGAAIIKYFASSFQTMPTMKVEKIGLGLGFKQLSVLNGVRAFLGETIENTNSILKLEANVDDMTAESIAYAVEKLFDCGAVEVFTMPVYMKKNRLGTLITVLCKIEDEIDIIKTIFKHTSTIGIRKTVVDRYVLNREEIVLNSEIGSVKAKRSYGFGEEKCKIEFDDLKKLADEQNKKLSEVEQAFKLKGTINKV